MFGTVADNLKTYPRKFRNECPNRADEQVMPLDWNQVADAEDEWIPGRRFTFPLTSRFTSRRKQLRIDSVVNDRGPATPPHPFQDQFANVFADANHSSG